MSGLAEQAVLSMDHNSRFRKGCLMIRSSSSCGAMNTIVEYGLRRLRARVIILLSLGVRSLPVLLRERLSRSAFDPLVAFSADPQTRRDLVNTGLPISNRRDPSQNRPAIRTGRGGPHGSGGKRREQSQPRGQRYHHCFLTKEGICACDCTGSLLMP